jgi:mycofactocin system glycosyltransferase
VSYVPSAALVVRTAAVGDGFDERLRVAEDVDLIWRSVAAGWRCRYEPGARVAHDHRTRLGPWVRRKAYYGTGAMPLADRHGEAVAPVVLPAWAAAAWLALVAQRRWSVPAAAALTVAATVRVAAEVDRCERPLRTAATLVPLTLGAGAAQTASALTRHWWPVAAVCCLASSRAQRAVLAAGVVEGLVDWRRSGSTLDPVRHLVAHRLDDLAYGAGLWWGAWRGCSLRPLLPAISLRRCSSRPVPAAPAAVAGRRDPLPVGD